MALQQKKYSKITLFGLAGTGTSSTGKEIAKRRNLQFVSTGNLMRKKADELGMTIYEFDALCAQDTHFDKELDKEIEKFGIENDNFIIESRLAWHFIPQSFKIKFICDFDERIRRVAQRESISIEAAKKKTTEREKVFTQRIQEGYHFDVVAPDEIFDLLIDTTYTPFNTVVEKIIDVIS